MKSEKEEIFNDDREEDEMFPGEQDKMRQTASGGFGGKWKNDGMGLEPGDDDDDEDEEGIDDDDEDEENLEQEDDEDDESDHNF